MAIEHTVKGPLVGIWDRLSRCQLVHRSKVGRRFKLVHLVRICGLTLRMVEANATGFLSDQERRLFIYEFSCVFFIATSIKRVFDTKGGASRLDFDTLSCLQSSSALPPCNQFFSHFQTKGPIKYAAQLASDGPNFISRCCFTNIVSASLANQGQYPRRPPFKLT